ncbi:hypothetical protein JCM10908_001431 [Rhodotorula pacifica]|uniref:histone-fold domain-containing protein n=1 Tax=Rhodotorula pacifica TaxID=1495444 RepID=UPI00317E531A
MAQSAIPTARVNRIIKADKDVRLCSKEAVYLISRAAERMIERSAAQAYETARLHKRNVKMVRYEHLAKVAHSPQWFYLAEVIPTSMPLSAALSLRQQNEDAVAATSEQSTNAGAVKRVVKSKSKKVPTVGELQAAVDSAGAGGAGGGRKTRGKKIQLPAGEGGGPEDENEDDDGDFEGEYSMQGEEGPSGAAGEGEGGEGMEVDP